MSAAGRVDDLSGRGQPVEHRLVAAELDHVVLDPLPRLGRYNFQREHTDHAVELELRISLLTRRPDLCVRRPGSWLLAVRG
jgi:hypothetical protein